MKDNVTMSSKLSLIHNIIIMDVKIISYYYDIITAIYLFLGTA